MNKQQLAATIWESANEMRSKIEANEYKDFILGFIFYKYLSEKELRFFKDEGMSDKEIIEMTESDTEYVDYVRNSIGYYVTYENLFSTWIKNGSDFDVSNVRDALSAFNRLINPSHKKVFEKIFNTLQTGLSKLGESAAAQTKAISGLLQLIQKIPMDGKQDYDVLGFIYEYLISMFAANAGKKAGEFYTPHEVSVLMSEIVAKHLKNRKEVKIYDPTSGSGSLLINIGSSLSKYMDGDNRIKYYAQELKENTYNLTRMNLVMRGIDPSNIFVRNGDTLEEDWPFFEDGKMENYQLIRVDTVVSNPPYSQKWDVSDKKFDPRYADYGVAPKGKADMAFLLHDLYHLEDDGIMTIVLPHGVLFRSGEEAGIRKNLIEKNNIEAIIGLPENIFFGTSIPTIIMVLRRKRPNTDVLIIDASKGFGKSGKNNVLRACDIKKIADAIRDRVDIPKYSVRVSKVKIRENEYNLNIPRYIDSSDECEPWDVYSTMFGGIPKKETDRLSIYWKIYPGLRKTIFREISSEYEELACEDIEAAVKGDASVITYADNFKSAFSGFYDRLYSELIDEMTSVAVPKEEEVICQDVFDRLDGLAGVDRYKAYQILDNCWRGISTDLEMIQSEGFDAVRVVDPNMVMKQKDGKKLEVQEGWIGHILPFELVQDFLLSDELSVLQQKNERLVQIAESYTEIIDSLSEEEKDSSILDDANTTFILKEVKAKVMEVLDDIEIEETMALAEYLKLSKKADKQNYISTCKVVDWTSLTAGKDGTYSKTVINSRIKDLKMAAEFPEDSFEGKLIRVQSLMEEESAVKKEAKQLSAELHLKTKSTIENLTDDVARELLEKKWIQPLVQSILSMPEDIVDDMIKKIVNLDEKYRVTFAQVEKDINQTEKELANMIDSFVGSEFDMLGLEEFKKMLRGVGNE